MKCVYGMCSIVTPEDRIFYTFNECLENGDEMKYK
jgi:hypothetical protein